MPGLMNCTADSRSAETRSIFGRVISLSPPHKGRGDNRRRSVLCATIALLEPNSAES
jgi:hypothetical protein